MPEQPSAPTASPSSLAERLQDVTEALAAATTPSGVFAIVLKPALEALNAIAGAVLLVNGAGDRLEIAATHGHEEDAQTIWQGGPLDGDVPAGDALKRHTSLFFERQGELTAVYPELEERTGALAPVANAVLPMFLDERPLGALVLDFKAPHHFTPAEIHFLRTLAAQCALALGRAHLTTELQRQVQDRTRQLDEERAALDAFVAYTTAVGSESDVLALARQAVRVVRTNLAHVSVAYYELEDGLWKARVWSDDLAPEIVAQIQRGVPQDAPNYAEAARLQAPHFVDGWDAEANSLSSATSYGAAAFLPLAVRGEVRSLFSVGTRDARAWKEREKALVRAVARGLDLTLERTEITRRLREQNAELDARTRALEAFSDLTRDLSVEVDQHTLVKRAQEVVMSLLTQGYALYYERQDGLWRNTVQTGELGPAPPEAAALQAVVDAGFPYGGPHSLVVPWTTRQPYYQDEYLRGGDTDASLVQHVNTVATLPVFVNSEIVGILCFVLFDAWTWTGTDKAVMETVVRSLGLALERTQGVANLAQRSQELERERTFLRAVLESLSEGIVACDPQGRLTLFNDATRVFHGQGESPLPPEAWTGQYDLFEGDGVTPLATEHIPLYRAWRGERVRDAEMVIRPRTSEARSIVANGQAIFTEGGVPLGAVVAMHDITRRKRVEEELRRSNAELEQFAYVASHDLQEPLRTVTSFSQLLASRYAGQIDEKGQLYVRLISEGTTRMAQLLQDLLAFSRVASEAGTPRPVDMAVILAQVVQDLDTQLGRTGARLAVGELPDVLGDASQLRQLFQNLIGNALKFSHPERTPVVRLEARRDGEMVRFSVSDNGIGIAPEYFERIFTIFQRLHTRQKYEGSGIGLSITRKIVERHGGQVWVESTPDVGTTFFFTLPAAELNA